MKNQKAITLISLVVTIIVLLILAGVSISALVGNNGIIRQAIIAKENTEIASEKEHLALAIDASYEDDGTDTKRINRNLVKSNLDGTLGEDKTTLYDYEEDVFYIKFNESNRYYEIDANGNINLAQITNGEKKLDIIYVTSDGAEIGRETKTILADEYSKTLENISYNSNTYIPSQTTVSVTITEDTEIKVKYYFLIPEEMMVFTGLTESGTVTTDESKIVSYMLGNNSATNGNGLNTTLSVQSVLNVPDTHSGKPVTSVSQKSFYNISKIVKLDLGNSVTSIGVRAFYRTGITELEIKDNITYIDNFAFEQTPITELTIGRGLTGIGLATFNGCSFLKKVIYNNESTAIIGKYNTFAECNNWTDIEVDEGNATYKVDGNVLYSKDGSKIIKVPTGTIGIFEINDEVNSVGNCAFAYCNITGIIFGDNVTGIGNQAFYKAKITMLEITDSITGIDSQAFCASSITEVTIGSGLSWMGNQVFEACSFLKKVIYNNETTSISSNIAIFNACNNWTEIEINEENTAFKVVENVLYSKDGTKIIKVPTGINGSFEINDEVNFIGAYALDNSQITDITIGNNVETIGRQSFYSTKITKLELGDKVKTIDSKAFENGLITEVTIGTGITTILSQAFYKCSSLKTVIINSETMSFSSQTAWGYLINYATTIYTKNNTPGSYITDNFDTVESDKEGYTKYVKKV